MTAVKFNVFLSKTLNMLFMCNSESKADLEKVLNEDHRVSLITAVTMKPNEVSKINEMKEDYDLSYTPVTIVYPSCWD